MQDKEQRIMLSGMKKAAHLKAIEGLEFHEWPKISRLNRDIVITEKIDGTNAAIGILEQTIECLNGPPIIAHRVYAQSRTRLITPDDDNMGFASWVKKHEEVLITTLGPGLHFGEWWGCGIQRGYDMSERRFSLFNTHRWASDEGQMALAIAREKGCALHTVPILYTGPWTGCFGYKNAATGEWLKLDEQENWTEVAGQENPRPRFAPTFIMEWLRRVGSQAAPDYMNPEGICVFHKAGGIIFKATLENDDKHKGEV